MAEFKDHNHLFIQLLTFAVCAIMFACSPEDQDDNTREALSITVGAEQITESSAVLMGKIILGSLSAFDLTVGFQYSTYAGILPSNSTIVDPINADADYNIKTVVTGLVPATTYYFRSFVSQNDHNTFGETMSFTTGEAKVRVENVSLDKQYVPLSLGEEVILSVTATPENAYDRTVTWRSSNENVALVDQNGKVTARSKGEATIKATANDGSGQYAECDVLVRIVGPIPPGAVDIGLSVYWASCNLCEDGLDKSSNEYGDYYAWGEVEPHYVKGHSMDNPCDEWRAIDGKMMTGYNWDSYKWYNQDNGKLTRYCPINERSKWDGAGTPDNKTEFSDYNYEDDAARATLSGKWRIPVIEEWEEVQNKCDFVWVTQNGVNGFKVTGPNGNSIFLPAAGRYFDDIKNLISVGSGGYYWSSSLYDSNALFAQIVGFNRYRDIEMNGDYRFRGFSVRPVSE